MGAKYTTNAASGYNSSPPADDGSQVAANLVKWSTHKTKLADPVKTLADDINTDLVAAFDYSVRQITASDNTVAGDHMRCVEIAPTVSSAVAVTVSLGDAATMTNIYRVYIKNSSPVAQTIGRVTAGDTINAVAGNLTIPAGQGVVLQTTTGANGYVTVASSHPLGLTAGRVPYMGNAAQGGKLIDASTFTFDGTTFSVPALTLTSTLTLSGTAANIATGANYISYGGTDAGLSFTSGNIGTFSAAITVVDSVLISGNQVIEGSGSSSVRALYGVRYGADSTNNLIFNASTGAGTATLYIGNASINVTSDERVKDNIRDTERDALQIFDQLRVVDHTWNDPTDQCVNNKNARGVWTGLLAQQADPHVPWLVNRPRFEGDEDFTWNMELAYMAPLFVKGFQQFNEWRRKVEAALARSNITIQ